MAAGWRSPRRLHRRCAWFPRPRATVKRAGRLPSAPREAVSAVICPGCFTWTGRFQRVPLITKVTKVRVTRPTRPVTCQQPSVGHVGVDEARVHGDHQGALMVQFDPDAVGQRPLRGLGGTVGGVEGVGEEAGHRQHVDDRAAAGGRQHRRERPAHAQRAEVVDLHLLPGRVQVRRAGERAVPQHPGVVHQQADVGVLRGDPGDLLAIGDVQGDRQHAGFGDRGGIARGPVDLGRAPADQFPGVGPAQSPVGPADQGDRSVDVHGVLRESSAGGQDGSPASHGPVDPGEHEGADDYPARAEGALRRVVPPACSSPSPPRPPGAPGWG